MLDRAASLVLEKGVTLHTKPQALRRTDGSVAYFTSDVMPVRANDGRIIGIFCIMPNVTEEVLAQNEIEALSDTVERDQMTGLLNQEATRDQVGAFLRNTGKGLTSALFMIDIDDFKNVNDTFGHQTGDEVIKGFAWAIKGCFRKDDIVGRVGGDEFAVLMCGVHSRDNVVTKAQSLIEALQCTCGTDTDAMDLTGSVGIAIHQGDDETSTELFARADNQLYLSKKLGKNRFSMAGGASGSDKGTVVIDDVLTGHQRTTVQLRYLLENMDGFMLVCEVENGGNHEVRFVYASPEADRHMLGSIDDDRGKGVLSSILPADRDAVVEKIRKAAATDGRLDVTYRAHPADGGRPRLRMAHGTRLPDDGGSVSRLLIVVQNVGLEAQ